MCSLKLNVVPDALSRLFGDTNSEEIQSEPRLAPICRNDQPYHRPFPPEFEVSTHQLDGIVPVESDRDLFTSAVSIFPVADPAQITKQQDEESGRYIDHLNDPKSSPLPPRETANTMSYFFLNENLLFFSSSRDHFRKRSVLRDQLFVPDKLRPLVIEVYRERGTGS